MANETYKGFEIEIRTHGFTPGGGGPRRVEILIFREFPGWIYRRLIQAHPRFGNDLDALKFGLQAARQVVDAL